MSHPRLPVFPCYGLLLLLLGSAVATPGCGGSSSARGDGGPADVGPQAVADSASTEVARDLQYEVPASEASAPATDGLPSTGPDSTGGLMADAASSDLGRGEGGNADVLEADARSGDTRITVDASAPDGRADALAVSPDLGKPDRASDQSLADPACTGADSTGFFAGCSSCTNSGDCNSITVGSRTRYACGCEVDADCPCGLSCGAYEIAAGIRVSGICVR